MLITLSALMGGSSAMLALSVIIVSTLIAASTGIIGATIVMLGLISLPSLLQAGVAPRLASGLICASGTLGQIIPPSIVLILLGDQISNAYIEAQRNVGNFAPDPVTVGDLFAGALLPGLLLVVLYAAYVVSRLGFSNANPSTSQQTDTSTRVSAWVLLRDAAPPILLILAVLGSILIGVATPTEAAAIGVGGALLLTAASLEGVGRPVRVAMALAGLAAFALVAMNSWGLTRLDAQAGGFAITPAVGFASLLSILLLGGLIIAGLSLRRGGLMADAVATTVHISAMIFGIVIAASLLSLVFRGFGGDQVVRELLTGVPGGPWGILAVTMAVIFLLGFVLEFVEIVFIVIPIIGPVLLETGFDPVWFAILVALNLQTSFLTPPFGFSLFYFRSVAPDSISTGDIYRSVVPFVVIQLMAIGIVMAFPALATWLPSALFG